MQGNPLESVRQHPVPDWFRAAKFGIWSHWGPQSVGASGDWYARHLYGRQASSSSWECRRADYQYAHHRHHFGPPSAEGAAGLMHRWRAERFDPAELMERYVRAGARYFVALAGHCDNFDLWDSPHPWNAARIGPRRDIVGAWERAARAAALPFGLSFHQNWAWRWLDVARGTDPETGAPCDGARPSSDRPSIDALYPRGHPPGAAPPAQVAADFYARVEDALRRYQPDLIYLDDDRLPFGPGSVVESAPTSHLGDDLVTRYYHRCVTGGIVTVKRLVPQEGTALMLDAERRQLGDVQQHPWQCDTSDGEWFYCSDDGPLFHPRKSAQQVVHALVDVVSKNGCMLLNIPQRSDGTIDEHSTTLLEELGAWLDVCGEGIYDTVPWKLAGEGPTQLGATRGYEKYNESAIDYGPHDLRFTRRGDAVYVTVLSWPPDRTVTVRSMGASAGLVNQPPREAVLLGHGAVRAQWDRDALRVRLPDAAPCRFATMIRIR